MEQYIAPVRMQVKYSVKRFDEKWSYQIKMDFSFDHHPDEKIQDEILTELGVYVFDSENECKIQAKRTAKAMEQYFGDELPKLISKCVEDE